MTDNPDLRKKVIESRGFLKKLQLAVPGLREYRKLEDIRAADEILRKQVFDNLDESKSRLEDIRKAMTDKGDFNSLTMIGSAITQIQQIAGEVFHAQQGSAGISPNIQIDENTLNKLYEYDYNFVSSAEQILSAANGSFAEYTSGTATAQVIASNMTQILEKFKLAWNQRLESVEEILVTK